VVVEKIKNKNDRFPLLPVYVESASSPIPGIQWRSEEANWYFWLSEVSLGEKVIADCKHVLRPFLTVWKNTFVKYYFCRPCGWKNMREFPKMRKEKPSLVFFLNRTFDKIQIETPESKWSYQ
jgi:hypothetical protein